MRLLQYAVLSLLLLIVSSIAWSFEIPALKTHVNDYAGILSEQNVSSIEQSSAALEKKEGTQVVVLTVKDMGDAADIKEYANKVFVSWGLGQKDVDNGVLIVLALKERMVRIEVGKGLEEYLTDAGSAQIIRSARAPLSKGDFNSGLLQISQQVQNAVSGKFVPSPAVSPQQTQPHKSAPWVEKTAAVVNTTFFSVLGLGILWVFWALNREPKRNKQKVDENQSSPSSGTTRVVKTWGPDEFKNTDSNRYSRPKAVLSKSDRIAMGITAAAATSAATTVLSKRRSDETRQESSWSPSYDSSSSSSSSSDCCSGGGGDSGGGGSDSSF